MSPCSALCMGLNNAAVVSCGHVYRTAADRACHSVAVSVVGCAMVASAKCQLPPLYRSWRVSHAVKFAVRWDTQCAKVLSVDGSRHSSYARRSYNFHFRCRHFLGTRDWNSGISDQADTSARFWPALLVFLTQIIGSTAIGYGLAFGIKRLARSIRCPNELDGADNLRGTHSNLVCANCGFSYSIAQPDIPDRRPRGPIETACPICGFANVLPAGSAVASGDRFLVDKVRVPQRWDSVIFWCQPHPILSMSSDSSACRARRSHLPAAMSSLTAS